MSGNQVEWIWTIIRWPFPKVWQMSGRVSSTFSTFPGVSGSFSYVAQGTRLYKINNGTGATVGSIWVSGMVYFDGSQWHGPGVLADSDALGDNRPSILAMGPGHLLIAQEMEHRLSPHQHVTG